jgi:hypothetical protein
MRLQLDTAFSVQRTAPPIVFCFRLSDAAGQSKVVPHKQSPTTRTDNPLMASLIHVWNGSPKDKKRDSLPKILDTDDDAFTPGGSPQLINKQQRNGGGNTEE